MDTNIGWVQQPHPAPDPHSARGASNDTTQAAGSADVQSSLDSGQAGARIRRRNRQITSCLECRRRKLKCDKQAPCTNCTRFRRDCLYLAPALDQQSQQKLASIKERMGALEKNLEHEVVQGKKPPPVAYTSNHCASLGVANEDADDDDDDDPGTDDPILQPSPLAVLDNVYEECESNELHELRLNLGKMRMNERVGGWVRPKLLEEIDDTRKAIQEGRGPMQQQPQRGGHAPFATSTLPPRKPLPSPESFISPDPECLPSLGIFSIGPNTTVHVADYLPSLNMADHLVLQYFHAVHYVARAVHRQSFDQQYAYFRDRVASGTEPPTSVQALVLAVLLSAAVSMSDAQCAPWGIAKSALVDRLRSGTEISLSKARLLRTTKMETLQAFIIYLLALVRGNVSRTHSTLVAAGIRVAECQGLHRDGALYGMTPLETHVRRILWYQLCILDLRTAEGVGPRPHIRSEDFDTKFPLNVDDLDFMSPTPPTTDKAGWTDMTFFRIRAEYSDLRRSSRFDAIQIDRGKKSLTASLVKTQKVLKSLNSRFLPVLDPSIPAQALALHIMKVGIGGCFTQILHRYFMSKEYPMPDRLREIYIGSGADVLEHAMAMDTKPELAHWSWYSGAYQQYHIALPMLVEVSLFPMRHEANRIWKCVDWVFEIPSHLPAKHKAEVVLTEFRDKVQVVQTMRRSRSTVQFEQRFKQYMPQPAGGLPVAQSQAMPLNGNSAVPKLEATQASSVPVYFTEVTHPPPGAEASGIPGQSTALELDPARVLKNIDWAEWNKYFPEEENSGNLNIPNFNSGRWPQGYDGHPNILPAPIGMVPGPGITQSALRDPQMVLPTTRTVAHADFAPSYYHHPYPPRTG